MPAKGGRRLWQVRCCLEDEKSLPRGYERGHPAMMKQKIGAADEERYRMMRAAGPGVRIE